MYNYLDLLIRLDQWERAQLLAEECARGNVARFGPVHSETKDEEELFVRAISSEEEEEEDLSHIDSVASLSKLCRVVF